MANNSSVNVIYILIVLIIVLFLVLAFGFGYFTANNTNGNSDNDNGEVYCTLEAKLCSDGSYVSRNPTLNCAFDPCPDEDDNGNGDDDYEEGERHFCTNEDREGEFCTKIYRPVCGFNNPEKIQCIRYPCAQTYSNSCEACHNENVLYWTEGVCPR